MTKYLDRLLDPIRKDFESKEMQELIMKAYPPPAPVVVKKSKPKKKSRIHSPLTIVLIVLEEKKKGGTRRPDATTTTTESDLAQNVEDLQVDDDEPTSTTNQTGTS